MGSDDAGMLQPSTDSWIPIAKDIREQLGDKAYLLDNYLSYLFAGLYLNPAGESAASGDEASTMLWNAIRCAMAGDDEEGKHYSLYPQVKKYVEEHPLPYQEELTRHNVYYVALASKLPVDQLPHFTKKARPTVKDTDIVRMRELYGQIGGMMEDFEPISRLRASVLSCLQVADPARIFLQGTVEALLFSLTYRDNETSKQVFQLLLD